MISGGNVYVPVGAATDSLVTKDGAVENGLQMQLHNAQSDIHKRMELSLIHI